MSKDIEILFSSGRRVPEKPRGRLWLWLLALVALLAASTTAVYWLTEWRWFASLGQSAVLRLRLLAPWAVGLATLGLAAAWLWVNWHLASRSTGNPIGLSRAASLASSRVLSPRRLAVLALLVAALPARDAASQWQSLWLYLHRQSFGAVDPIFGRDVAFYMFELPLWWSVWRLAATLIMLAALGALAVYVVAGALDLGSQLRSGGLEWLPTSLRRLPRSVLRRGAGST